MGQTETPIDSRQVGGEQDRSSGEIKEKIEETRSRMDRTLDQLSDRIDPKAIFDGIIDAVTGRGHPGKATRKTARALVRPIRENPLPALALGASVLWLIAESGSDDDDEDLVDMGVDPFDGASNRGNRVSSRFSDGSEDGEGVVLTNAGSSGEDTSASFEDKAIAAGNAVKDKVVEAGIGVKEALTDAGGAVQGAVSSAASSVSEHTSRARLRVHRSARRGRKRGSNLYGDTSERLHHAVETSQEKYRQGLDQNPLGMAIGFLGVGLLAGSLVPITRREDELMGERSDELLDAVKETGEDFLEKGKRVVERVAHTTMDQVDGADVDTIELSTVADDLKATVLGAVSEVKKEAKDAANDEGLTAKQLKEQAGLREEENVSSTAKPATSSQTKKTT